MNNTLHLTSGDCVGELLVKSGIPGEVFVWHDIMYDGPRHVGWPDDEILIARSQFLEHATAGGLNNSYVLGTLEKQYQKLKLLDLQSHCSPMQQSPEAISSL